MKRLRFLSLLLVIALFTTMAGVTVFAANNGPYEEAGSPAFIIFYGENENVQIYTANKNIKTGTIKGVSYDRKTNTLTLNNVSKLYGISANMMGEDFKIAVKGTNSLMGIMVWGDGYGSNLTITGDGTLILNKDKKVDAAIDVRAESTKGLLKIEKNVTLEMYAGKGNSVIQSSLTTNANKKQAIQIEGKTSSNLNVKQIKDKYTINEYIKAIDSSEREWLRKFEKDGKIYAIPTRFRIPLLVGKQETLAGIQDLQSFADTCEKLRAESPDGSILSAYQPDIVLRMLALACEPSWSREDGTLEEAAVQEFLTQAKRIYDAEISGISESDMEEFLESNRSRGDEGGSYAETALDISFSIMNFLTRSQEQFGLGNTQQVSLDFTNVISIPRVRKEIVFTTPSFQNSKVFQAESIMGVSAKAARPEMAKDFIQTLLSYEVMASQEEPYPVNKASFDRMFYTEMDLDTPFGSYGIAKEDGSVLMLDLYWPNEEEQKSLKNLVSSLDTPYLRDSRIEQAVVAAGTQVLNGELSVEEGVAQIKQKVQLYLAE